MNFNDLLEIMEIDSPDELAYFEQFSALMEYDDEIPFKLFSEALSEADADMLVELTESYFEDILKGIPDDCIDIFTLISTIHQALLGMARSSNTPEERSIYVEELFKFRNWYMFESVVHCRNFKDNTKKDLTISEAFALYRVAMISEEEYGFDFSDAMDYEIDEYTISIDAAIDEEYEEIVQEDEEIYEEGLIHPDYPVIDGEDLDIDDLDYEE